METSLAAMRKIFKAYRGSQAWAARELNVKPTTVSKFLDGLVLSSRLATELPPLAEKIVETGGKCICDVNGKSVRSQLPMLKRRVKRNLKRRAK